MALTIRSTGRAPLRGSAPVNSSVRQQMKDRREYEKAIEIIGAVVRAWDPYRLMHEGAPSDEFEGQIARITAKSRGFESPEDVATAISAVFEASFGPNECFSRKDCAVPAHEIFRRLHDAKLLSAA